jgi:DNA ligase-1
MTFKPMLAASCDDLNALRYPGHVTDKIDGIRCLIIDRVAMSRSLKPIPNRFIQSVLGRPDYNGLDGELLVGKTFQSATSGIMSVDGEPDFTFYVFDDFSQVGRGYLDRVVVMRGRILYSGPRLKYLFPVRVNNRAELNAYLVQTLAAGNEGAMFRSANGPYKYGRATFNEGYLTKVKPVVDAEATVIGFEERMHNANEATTNALGHTERSSHQANLVPMGTLGALVCRNDSLWPGQTFRIGTGFDDLLRHRIWEHRYEYLTHIVKFKYQAIGTVDKPRIPVFLGFRDPLDL